MVKMMNFMLCIFYDFFNEVRKSPNTRDSVAQRALAAPGCAGSEDQRGASTVVAAPVFPKVGQSQVIPPHGALGNKAEVPAIGNHRGPRYRL